MSVRIMCAARVRMLVFRPVTMEPIADLFGYERHAPKHLPLCSQQPTRDFLPEIHTRDFLPEIHTRDFLPEIHPIFTQLDRRRLDRRSDIDGTRTSGAPHPPESFSAAAPYRHV